MVSIIGEDLANKVWFQLNPMSESMPLRKVVHVDMDAFYASVEQRDNPEFAGQACHRRLARQSFLVCAASYERELRRAVCHGCGSCRENVSAGGIPST